MLLQITNKCDQCCKHCFTSATMDGSHMSMDTVQEFISFHKRMGDAHLQWLSERTIPSSPKKIVISGGEPTLHPEFRYVVQEIAEQLPHTDIIIESNGMWIYDEVRTTMVEQIMDHTAVRMMLTSAHKDVSSHYTHYMLAMEKLQLFADTLPMQDTSALAALGQEVQEVSKLVVDADWLDTSMVIPLGRGVPFGEKAKYMKPPCVMYLKSAHEANTMAEYVVKSEFQHHYSVPYITYNGDIHVGVCSECVKVGHVSDEPNDVLMNIRNADVCDACGLRSRMSEKELLELTQLRKYGVPPQ